MSSKMEQTVYALVSCLADNYGFDADEAFEYVRWETDVDHVGEILKVTDTMPKKMQPAKQETPVVADDDTAKKIAECKKNISLWEKKLGDGKVKDADKQREKITKEKAKLAKLEAKLPAVVSSDKMETKPEKVDETKKEEEKKTEKDDKKEKRIKRFSPVMASQLKTALDGAGVEMNDKLKKEFQQYIEDLTDDDYRASGLADHMRAFAKLKSPEKKVEQPEKDDTDDKNEVKKVEQTEKKVEKPETPTVVDVPLEDLRKIEMVAEIDTPGTYWDADNGRFVKGPEADDDEDVDEIKYEGKEYVVGVKTGRVYEVRDTGDVFAGFAGVGKFKAMKVA